MFLEFLTAWFQKNPMPARTDVAEQDLIGELDKFRSEVTDELLRQQYLGGRAAVQLGLASRPSFDGQRDRDGQDGRAGERAEGEVLV